MKIQLDTAKKTIKVEESVKLSKLIDTLKKLFPNNEWKDFTLETDTVIQGWAYPIVYPSRDPYPWWQPGTYSTGSDTRPYGEAMLNAGVYNVEV